MQSVTAVDAAGDVVKLGQLSHLLASTTYVPGAQFSHADSSVASTAAENLPALHDRHAEPPCMLEYLPAPHEWHADIPKRLAYVPALQAVQADALESGEKEPGWQSVQSHRWELFLNVPLMHATQIGVEPEYPGGQDDGLFCAQIGPAKMNTMVLRAYSRSIQRQEKPVICIRMKREKARNFA